MNKQDAREKASYYKGLFNSLHDGTMDRVHYSGEWGIEEWEIEQHLIDREYSDLSKIAEENNISMEELNNIIN